MNEYQDESGSGNWETINSTPAASIIRPLHSHSYRKMKGRVATPALKQSFPLRSVLNVLSPKQTTLKSKLSARSPKTPKQNTHKRWSLSRHKGKENSPREIVKKAKMQCIVEKSAEKSAMQVIAEKSGKF